MIPLFALSAAAEPGITPEGGLTIFQPCLDEPECVDYFAPQLSETLAEAGYAMQADPVATSALGARGTKVVAELSINSTPLGPPNAVQALYPPVPAVGRFAVGGLYALDQLQLGLGLHGLPRLQIGEGSTSAFGLLGSAAWVPLPQVRLGGELSWTRSAFAVSLLENSGKLREIEELAPYIKKGVECFADPCVDKLVQKAVALRVGAAIEPVPFAFGYVRAGLVSQHQRLQIALDGSGWRLSPVSPELSAGLGVRAKEIWQLSLGLAAARRPEAASATGRGMVKLQAATSVLMGLRSEKRGGKG